MTKERSAKLANIQNFAAGFPFGYSRAYVRSNRRVFEKCQPKTPSCSALGSRSLTASIISYPVKLDINPQLDMQANAKIPDMTLIHI
jgi:hypothetical protein